MKDIFKAYKVQYGLGFQKYYLFTAYIFTKKQAKYVLQKNKYSLVLENKYDSLGILPLGAKYKPKTAQISIL